MKTYSKSGQHVAVKNLSAMALRLSIGKDTLRRLVEAIERDEKPAALPFTGEGGAKEGGA